MATIVSHDRGRRRRPYPQVFGEILGGASGPAGSEDGMGRGGRGDDERPSGGHAVDTVSMYRVDDVAAAVSGLRGRWGNGETDQAKQ